MEKNHGDRETILHTDQEIGMLGLMGGCPARLKEQMWKGSPWRAFQLLRPEQDQEHM